MNFSKKTLTRLGIGVGVVLVIFLIVGIVFANFDGFSFGSSSSEQAPANLQCSLKELKTYELNKTYDLSKDSKTNNIGYGWADSEVEGRWTLGKASSFYYYVENVDDTTRFFVTIEISDSMAYSNKLFLNDTELGAIQLPSNLGSSGGTKRVCFVIPSGIVKQGVNEFVIKTDDDVKKVPHRFPKYDFEDDNYNLFLVNIFFGTLNSGLI